MQVAHYHTIQDDPSDLYVQPQKKFKRTIEDFTCEICSSVIKGNGYTNHCTNCLYSKHVDVNPGDRASTCRGMMRPAFKGSGKKGEYLIHECEKCGTLKKNKISPYDNKKSIDKIPFEEFDIRLIPKRKR